MTNRIEIIIAEREETANGKYCRLGCQGYVLHAFPVLLPLDVLSNQRYVTSFAESKKNNIEMKPNQPLFVPSSAIRASGIYQSENICYDWNNDKAYNSSQNYVCIKAIGGVFVRRLVPRMFIMLCWHKTARRPHLHFYRIYPCFRFSQTNRYNHHIKFFHSKSFAAQFFLKIELDYPFMAVLPSPKTEQFTSSELIESECILMPLSNLDTWHFHFNSLQHIFGPSLTLEMSDGHPWRKFVDVFFIFIGFFVVSSIRRGNLRFFSGSFRLWEDKFLQIDHNIYQVAAALFFWQSLFRIVFAMAIKK